MKTKRVAGVGKLQRTLLWLSLLAISSFDPLFAQQVPVRLSFKFILNAGGNRPAAGNINTDAEVTAQVTRGNDIFARFISELRLENLEIVDAAGISSYYAAEPTDVNRDNLRSAAQANPSLYRWRSDAINFYINASTGTNGAAISDFPPNNNIVLVSQGAFLTTVPHETGHSLNLIHTHESDNCGDTLPDDKNWTSIDQMAVNSFGVPYSQLNPGQQYQVAMTWTNLMSYHDPDDRSMLSPCQMDRQSTQTYADRNWILSRIPVYVKAGFGGSPSGTFTEPFATIQQAINAGGLDTKVLVLQTGTHPYPSSSLSSSMYVVTRQGASTVQEAPARWSLPYALENSTNTAVREPVISAQKCDRQKDTAGAIQNLRQAEREAKGREKMALQLELAQRLRDSGRYNEAAAWFKKLADDADQEPLRQHALKNADQMAKRAKAEEQSKPK